MENQELKCKILIYTRKPCKEYTDSLSNSIHFAYCDGNGEFELYHGVAGVEEPGPRSTTMHRVHINKDRVPVFNLVEEMDLDPQVTELVLKIVVE